MENLEGKRFGLWTVIKRTQSGNCLCKCDCGTGKEVKIYNLKSGKSTSCGCARKNDLVGKKIGKLTIMKRLPMKKSYVEYECLCDCGNTIIKAHSNLVSTVGEKCCSNCKTPKVEDISGKRFGRLTAIKYIGKSKGKQTLWECKCDCGNIAIAHHQNLKSGHTSSCGCYNSEVASEREKEHGQSGTRLYNIWHDMIYRCYNGNHRSYKDYGGKGIIVCNEWKDDFEAFRNWAIENGYKENLSIDRIDSDKNYCPENCRWATDIQQANNTSRNLIFTVDGCTDTLANLCRKYNIPYTLAHSRIYRNWDIKKALTEPSQRKRARN